MDIYTVFNSGWTVILWLSALLVSLGVWVWAVRKKSLGLIEEAKTHVRRKRQAEKSNINRENQAHE